MKYGIYIGADAETLSEIKESVLAILNSKVDNATMVAALNVISNAVRITNTTISNVHIATPTETKSEDLQ